MSLIAQLCDMNKDIHTLWSVLALTRKTLAQQQREICDLRKRIKMMEEDRK